MMMSWLLTTFELTGHTASYCDTVGKLKEISQDVRKRNVIFHNSTNLTFMFISRSFLQTIITTMGMFSHHKAQEGNSFLW